MDAIGLGYVEFGVHINASFIAWAGMHYIGHNFPYTLPLMWLPNCHPSIQPSTHFLVLSFFFSGGGGGGAGGKRNIRLPLKGQTESSLTRLRKHFRKWKENFHFKYNLQICCPVTHTASRLMLPPS